MAEFDLQIVLDDRRLFKSLDDTERKLEEIDKEAQKTGQTMSRAFNSSTASASKFNSEIAKTERGIDRTTNKAKSASSRLRGFRRNILAAFTGAGILGAFSQLQGFVEGVGEAISKYRASTDAAYSVNQRLSEATKNVSAEFVNEQAKVTALFGALKDTNEESEKDTRGKIDKKAAIQAINDQYGKYLPNLLTESSSLEEIEAAQRAVNAAVIDRIALQARQQVLQQLSTEVLELTRAEQAYKNLDESTKSNIETTSNLADAFSFFSNIPAGILDIEGTIDKQGKKLRQEIDLVGQSSDAFAKNLQEAFASLGDEFFEQIGVSEEFVESTNNAAKATKKQKTEVELLDGSLAKLNKDLAEVKKQQDEVVGTAENLAPLIAKEEEINRQIEEQKALRESLKTVTEEQIQEQVRLIEEAFLSEEDRAINNTIRQAEERQQQIDDLKASDDIKAELTRQNQEALNTDLAAINEKFRGQEAQAEIDSAQKQLDEQIKLQEAQLKAVQQGELLRLKQTGATEEEVTALLAQQERQRQQLTLESERKRLELVLRFSEGRSEAEIEATKALIAGINSEIENLNLDLPQQATDTAGGGFFANLLGISDEELAAVKEAGALALQQVQALADKRAEIAAQNVERRTDEVNRLSQLLELELQANEQGFASNVDALRARIAEEEKARQEALQQQAKAQRTQILLDTATQASSLITSSANIFKSLSALGPIGVGLAVATIATMLGAFAASKASALQATKLYAGGRIPTSGSDDRNGGRGHKVQGTNIVVGAGEWVINRKASDKHNAFLDALNAGAFDNVDLMSMLEGAKAKDLNNLTINIRKQQQANSAQIQRNAIKDAIQAQTQALEGKLESILKAPQVQVTEDGYYKIINTQNSLTIDKIIIENGD